MENLELQKEINALSKKFNETKKANTVKDDFPEIKRTYTYRKTTSIHGLEAIK